MSRKKNLRIRKTEREEDFSEGGGVPLCCLIYHLNNSEYKYAKRKLSENFYVQKKLFSFPSHHNLKKRTNI